VADGSPLRVRLVRRVGVGRSEEIFEPLPGEFGASVAPSDATCCSLGVVTSADSVEEMMSMGYERRRGMATSNAKTSPVNTRRHNMILGLDLVLPHALRHTPSMIRLIPFRAPTIDHESA
jgi:hypothetical protein